MIHQPWLTFFPHKTGYTCHSWWPPWRWASRCPWGCPRSFFLHDSYLIHHTKSMGMQFLTIQPKMSHLEISDIMSLKWGWDLGQPHTDITTTSKLVKLLSMNSSPWASLSWCQLNFSTWPIWRKSSCLKNILPILHLSLSTLHYTEVSSVKGSKHLLQIVPQGL